MRQQKPSPAKSGRTQSANRFNNFHQREYDYSQLEKQLLEKAIDGPLKETPWHLPIHNMTPLCGFTASASFATGGSRDARIREAYAAVPRLPEIDGEVAALSLKKARVLLGNRSEQDFDLTAALEELAEERRALLLSNGYPLTIWNSTTTAPMCRIRVFPMAGKCACFRRTETELLYEQSNLREVLKEDNFEHFSLDYYSDEIVSESSGLTARQTAAFALKCARDFVAGFSEDFSNLCLYGDTGVGKTFLSHCIARDLIEAGFSVLYLTSFELFEQLEQHKFSNSEEAEEAYRHLFECDLLIIDDLGTELTNSFVFLPAFSVRQRTHSAKEIHDYLHESFAGAVCTLR